jgi:hypothetical protein
LLVPKTLQIDDIILTQEQLDAFYNPKILGRSRIDEKYHWPNATIPYSISESEYSKKVFRYMIKILALSFSSSIIAQKQISIIENALAFISKITCFKFVRQTTELDFVELLVSDSSYREDLSKLILTDVKGKIIENL